MIKIGRYTAALSLTSLGILLLLDHAGVLDALRVLSVWWPVALVALGVELILVQSVHRHEGRRVGFSFGTLFGAAVLGGFVLIAARGNEINLSSLRQWTDGIGWGFYDSERAKHSFDKGVTVVPIRDPSKKVTISDVNGDVTLREGSGSDIEVKAVVYVDVTDRTKAESLAERSAVQVMEGESVEIVANGQPYGKGNLRKPRMDITVTLPRDRMPSSLEVLVGSGSVRLERLTESVHLALDVKNGDITGERIGGTLQVKLLNGDIRLADLHGNADLESVNGNMEIRNPLAALTAKNMHGDILVRSGSVGGDWNVSSTIGDVTLAWPENAGVTITAKSTFGDIEDDWSLQVREHEDSGTQELSGKLGDGSRHISAETVGDIKLEKHGA
ncbi:DUF4097 family beta strand repeat protein [Cohnella sp. CFH 77786]|uniref:DUF4097 family beta strand repeat-containing protein n=1 Tax=Cohnella sp. CFH 77786 TaxID=2662265 RepID=UPI001C60E91F|nr:DUF4097 family beta strand repeat-containing protein [Cohnella sp. CFH 77786]MBW5449387.1 DUF4097 family beta strand repeat protein [Cohnella sp. CFH 77786]